MKVLVFGGTQFIGRHVVMKLLEANHNVTLLNRNKTAPGLFPDLPSIKADREHDDLKNIKELQQDWDAVIDLCAFYPKNVESLLETLKGHAGRYILCSTLSAYIASSMEGQTPTIDENSPLRDCTPEEAVDTTMATYGQRKAQCERVAMKQSHTPTVTIRPSLVYGAFDHTDRFAYWIYRATHDQPFILPDDGLTITRRTYAPDLAQAFVSCVTSTSALGNAYNIAETDPLNFRDTTYLIGKHAKKKPLDHAISISSDWLLKEGVSPWSDLSLWLPRVNLLVDTHKSRKDLNFVSTPPEQALAEATDAFLKENRVPKAGLSLSAEKELLTKFLKKPSI